MKTIFANAQFYGRCVRANWKAIGQGIAAALVRAEGRLRVSRAARGKAA